ncbi:hypothetical protein [Paenibacillus sonchi]|uniref:hypothetical protein n=1 Tax=Paenibacillus sonchi TaxID=373687 RepID=UPI001E3D7C43|nr:hypothetical protein [Paenibacillus sonchi]MCE3200450.1 hypothetical protein [Paenibacillus sonchi]
MKKKVVVGLLTVAACFSLGSTSFASSIPTTQVPNSSLSETSGVITPNDFNAQVFMKVGDERWFGGSNFRVIYNPDSAVEVHEDGLFIARNPGHALVAADYNGIDVILYSIYVQ